MTYQAKNNAFSTLAGSLTNVATTLTVQAGHGDRFPVIASPNHTVITLEDASGNREIVKVTARASASDSMTIVRGQEGTTARAWAAGDSVELRMTAGQVQDMFNHIGDEVGAHSANNITNVPSGNLAATDVQSALNELQTDIDTRATSTSVAAQIAALVNSSPLALDTLNELAAALGNDPNFVTTITNALALKAPLASPTLTGTPAAPTAALGTNTTQLATTAFVKAAVDAIPVVPDATELVKGIVELATDAEAQAFTANKFIDGSKLNTALKGANQSLAASGYQKLNGGLIIQWGIVTSAGGTVTITLPLTFPNAIFTAVASFGTAGAPQNPEQIELTSLSQITITNYANGSTTKRWIAIGY